MVFNSYARYYDLLYRDKDYAQEAEFVAECLRNHGVTSGTLLELGCGTGRHALEMARLGYGTHGTDFSEEMVQRAQTAIPTEYAQKLHFEVGDVRTCRLNTTFEAVVSLFHVASYQTENADITAMFQTAHTHLEPGGLFLFDCWYGPAVLTERPSVREKTMEDEDIFVLRHARPVMHPNRNVVDVNYTVKITEKSTNRLQTVEECHSMRYFFRPELELLMQQIGFELLDAMEWLSRKPLDFTTWSATFIARKI